MLVFLSVQHSESLQVVYPTTLIPAHKAGFLFAGATMTDVKDIAQHKDYSPPPSPYEALVTELFEVCNKYSSADEPLFVQDMISALEIVRFSYLTEAVEWVEYSEDE